MKHFLLQLCCLSLFATTLLAHSNLEKSEPKDGAELKQAPNELRMWFSEPLKIVLSTVEVRDSGGKQVNAGNLRPDKSEPSQVHISLPNLPSGTYKVSWTAVAEDMHVTKGQLTFHIVP